MGANGEEKDAGGAQRAVDTVRKAIRRFHHGLSQAVNTDGNPHPVLRPFADHLQKHLLSPSARYSGPGITSAKTGFPGCLTYEPPPGVSWAN
jgi:hypothetical protein